MQQVSKISSRANILERIKESGYETQNEQLLQLGYAKYSQNLKYLKLYEGDVQIIASKLGEKRTMKKEKSAQREESKENKYEPARQKKQKTDKVKEDKVLPVPLKEFLDWPSDIETLYLDGNNMLYVEDAIRSKAIGRGKKKAEKMLTALALEFAKLKANFNVVLIFDSTNLTPSHTINVNGKEFTFKVVSARPSFPDSDDALAQWSGELSNKSQYVFVTSDRGLQVRIHNNGIENIMKTKKWFNFVKSSLGEENYYNVLKQQTEADA